MRVTKDDIPKKPADALMMVTRLRNLTPPVDTNEWLFIAEIAERMATVTEDPAWADVVVAAHTCARPAAEGFAQVEEMSVRVRMLCKFGPQPNLGALNPDIVLCWLRQVLGALDVERTLQQSRRLKNPPTAPDSAWLAEMRQIRTIKRTASVARNLASTVALPADLLEWTHVIDDL